jgi:transcriptional regulator with XRE-family HTH domain
MPIGIPIRSVYPLRQARGWTQAETARRMGVSTQTYINLETGTHDPSPTTLRRLAIVFRVTVTTLIL